MRQEHTRVGTFTIVMGSPTMRALEDKSGRALKPQDGVYTATSIKTDDADKAEIRFNDGTTLALNFNTTLEIPNGQSVVGSGQLAAAGDQKLPIHPSQLKLSIGHIWVEVQKLAPESKFEIDTPVATAAVRGTEFGLKVRRIEQGAEGKGPSAPSPMPLAPCPMRSKLSSPSKKASSISPTALAKSKPRR